MTEQTAATRAAATQRLESFLPRIGRIHTKKCNFDRGPGAHRDVSRLSPFIRRRLITEPEVIVVALEEHGAERAEKFVQEVIWPSYFKGWLERRPQVWDAYTTGLAADLAALEQDTALKQRIEDAERGATGLACFDAWAQELIETGYLHNHARMWFASIWIFAFRLPWRLARISSTGTSWMATRPPTR